MKRFPLWIAAAVTITAGSLQAQTSAPSDNPTAGLNLGDDSGGGTAPSPYLEKFRHHLVTLSDDRIKPASSTALDGVKFVAFYYSAKWCPPCRAFSPKLVSFYNSFKPTHPNFELIFVSRDNDADGMLSYMQIDHMPWLAVAYDDVESSELHATQLMGQYIPCLVLVDDTGKVLADTNVGGQYVGPEQVMDKISALVPTPKAGPATAGL